MAARAFRVLWRTQRAVLGNDAAAGALARARIRSEFRKNMGATPTDAEKLIETAMDASKLARATILQARLDPKSGRYRARVESHHAVGKEAGGVDDGT